MDTPDKRHLVVVYHDNCIDGLASAWSFDQRFGKDDNIHISYIPYGHHETAEAEDSIRKELTRGAEVFFVDVAPTKAFLDELASPLASGLPAPASITVIDHHKSAAEALAGYAPPAGAPRVSVHIDENHPSAANLVWETLLPEREKPPFLAMIAKMDLARDLKDDRDLAAAALIDSKSIRTVGDAFHSFGELEKLTMHDMVTGGLNILSDQANRIDKLTDNIMYTRLVLLNDKREEETLWVPVINADVQNFGRHISDYLREQGDRTGLGMAFAWYVQGNGAVSMSIRSDGDPDASTVAEILCAAPGVTGGGHKTSAAVHFTSLQQFSELVPLYTEEQMLELKKKAAAPEDDIKPPPRIAAGTKLRYPRFG